MYQTIHAIALRTVRHSDSTSILTAWSAEAGRIAILMGTGASAAARQRRAATMPLSLFTGTVRRQQTMSDMPVRMRDIAPTGRQMIAVATNPVKAAVAMFLAEVLYIALREAGPDKALWHLFERALPVLEGGNATVTANFHLWFLYNVAVTMGVGPDLSEWRRGRIFDLRSAVFRDSAPGHSHYVEAAEARMVYILGRISASNLGRMRLNRQQRNHILDVILEYYSEHIASMDSLHSLDVIRSM